MLGVRLDEETERGLEAIARRTGRPKSRIAREAIRNYVLRNDRDGEARAQWRAISEDERDDRETDALLEAALREVSVEP